MSILLFYARNIFLLYATLEFHLKDKIKPEFFQAFFSQLQKLWICDDLLSCNWFILVKVWRVFIQQTHFLGWPDIRMFRIQRCFTWLTIDETYGWVNLGEEKKCGVKVPCIRKQRDGRGLNPGPPDPQFEVSSPWPHMPPGLPSRIFIVLS